MGQSNIILVSTHRSSLSLAFSHFVYQLTELISAAFCQLGAGHSAHLLCSLIHK